ncbi:MAG TPA: DUF418 domain-containing protein [Steroidobacteraceae bacterium]|nr:DUF418 domain-containing protein [Steroidobacteraceae bacterium]
MNAPLTVPAAPIQPGERIEVLDAIRGCALLGIFIMNVPAFNTSLFLGFGSDLWPQWWDRSTETVRDLLFSGKFNSMFSMLFAVGFTIQLERLHARAPQRAVRIYLRRLFWLFVFGAIHACVFWAGDVLHMYALLGLVLLALRRVPSGFIVAAMIACLLYPAIMGTVRMATFTPEDMHITAAIAQRAITADNAAFGHGGFLDTVRRSTADMILLYAHPHRMGTIAAYVQFLTTVLLGLLLGRHRFFQDAAAHMPLVRRVQWWALGIGLVCGVVYIHWRQYSPNPGEPSPWKIAALTGYVLCRVAIMLFYVATIVRAMNDERWRRRLAPITLTGRLPLTNYLLQTLIATFLFYNWGLGLWGKVGPALDILLAVAIFFVVQVPLSRWWLSRFQLGPMEYLWRVLTYGRGALVGRQRSDEYAGST